jgi:RHH-type transcriptional regulator, proline utilization regulon repressor / proline dehydrogenase / delta 1-pyrroline-5-carboxylate dehydrogenase
VVDAAFEVDCLLVDLPPDVRKRILLSRDWNETLHFASVLIEGNSERINKLNTKVSRLPGPIPIVQATSTEAIIVGDNAYNLSWLVDEVSVSINTTAAGGNASLMMLE